MRRRLAACLALALCGCVRSEACAGDADCAGDVCVEDLDRGDRYCTSTCEADADCPAERACQATREGGDAGQSLCLERVRRCGEGEGCNGLDDDCDGAIDEGCQTSTCFDDAACGLYACALVVDSAGAPARACMPPVGPGLPGDPCDEPADCYNNACPYGECAPMCGVTGCADGTVCVTAGVAGAPDLSACVQLCDGSPCPAPRVCRVAFNWPGATLATVCADPAGDGAYGDACDRHEDCSDGLCVLATCTRPCAGGNDCLPQSATCEAHDVRIAPDVVAPSVDVCVY